ncbi:hypothetical protein VTP01DRAFT_8341 [Rhizomucor pusillus]|uniref:uncharacterized protein n=1 Tax=Rhizomucor pusillus TaxID=4840 RepID=UPI0037449F6D
MFIFHYVSSAVNLQRSACTIREKLFHMLFALLAFPFSTLFMLPSNSNNKEEKRSISFICKSSTTHVKHLPLLFFSSAH